MTTQRLPFLAHLNNEQYKAVLVTQQHLRVLAGAGSGKTQVIVSRIVALQHIAQVLPTEILAVTFTNKAAREMESRLKPFFPHLGRHLWVGTFHHLAHRILRQHCHIINLSKDFQILDAADQLRRIRRVIQSMKLDEGRFSPKSAQWFINQKKDTDFKAARLSASVDPYQKTLNTIYQHYEESCQQDHVLDFSDLLLRSRDLLQKNPDILAMYHQRFRYILVDEFQDTSRTQYEWIRLLVGPHTYLTIVGDDDQSIYGWRGAKIENMHRFEQDFLNNQTIRLEQNYRSTGTILSAANALIAHNQQRLGKNLWTNSQSGKPIQIYEALSDVDEARFIVKRIQKAKANMAYQDMSVLYRSNAQSRIIEEALVQANIPYRVYGGLQFFERTEIKDTLAYLRLMHNPKDNSSLERIINTPPRGIGEKTLSTIRDTAQQESISYYEATQRLLAARALTTRSANALNTFFAKMQQLREAIKNCDLAVKIETVLKVTGLIMHYEKEPPDTAQTRLDNINELVYAARQFLDSEEEEKDLATFLNRMTLDNTEYQTTQTNDDKVQLMTLHASKGLEFPIVFLTGLEEGLFPNHLALNKPGDIEEERRLCYVGITRAMHELYITYAKIRSYHGTESYRLPSRFIEEIPSEYVSYIQQPFRKAWDMSSRYRTAPQTTTHSKQIADTEFSIQQKVHHASFGVGTILDYEGEGSYTRLKVKFDTVGVKWLILHFAQLKPVT